MGDYRSDCNIDAFEWQATGDVSNSTNFGVLGGKGTKFIMSASFENTDVTGGQISGINAEEQSDIALTITGGRAGPQTSGPKLLQVFVAYDSLIIVRGGNVVDLVL